MSADTLLARLDKVKRTGPGRWMTRCPAHGDRKASLAVRELDDGRLLVHCFADCDTENVLSAVGLTFDDLYPEPLGHHFKPERRPFPASDVLRCLGYETLLVAVAAAHLGGGITVDAADRERLMLAASRIRSAIQDGAGL